MASVSLTVSLPKETKELMEQFDEINWSGFVRKSIEEKVRKLVKFEEVRKELEAERDITDWSVKLQRASRSGRMEELKRKGLI